MSIGMKLKNARLASGLTQEALSEKLGVSRQTISSWENERTYPDIMCLIQLSDLYDLTLDSLIKGDDEMLKDLQKKTDTVQSYKQLVQIFCLWGIVYVVGYFIQTFLSVPKITNQGLNGMLLFLAGGILLWKGSKSTFFEEFLMKQTANKTLVKFLIGFMYLLGILILPTFLNQFFEQAWQQGIVRSVMAFILAIPCLYLWKKLKTEKG